MESPPSEDEMTVEEGVAEINRIEGMASGTRGAGALACIALGRAERVVERGDGLMMLMLRRMA